MLESVYGSLPRSVQRQAFKLASPILARRRYGQEFSQILAATLALDYATPEQIASIAAVRLETTLSAAGQRGAERELAKLRSNSLSIGDLADWVSKSLPLMDKEQARNQIKSNATGRGGRIIKTSGSTGNSLAIPISQVADDRKWATWWRFRIRHGIVPGEWSAHFGGKLVTGSPSRKTDEPWIIDPSQNRVYFSQYHIDESNLPNCLKLLEQTKIRWWHGFPSVIHNFIRLCLDADLELDGVVRPHWITAGAETPTESFYQLAERATSTVPVQSYGLAEAVVNASECTHGMLHSDDDYGLLELVGQDLSGPKEIIGTSLWNDRTPLVRYRTGDLIYTPESACDCGLPFRPLAKRVDGRIEDQVVLGDGRKVGRLGRLFHDLDGVRLAQIRQYEPGSAILLLDMYPSFDLDMSAVQRSFDTFLGGSFKLEEVRLHEFDKRSNYKHRLVVSEIGSSNEFH